MGLMAVTNGEVATLQEAGVSRTNIERLTRMLEALDLQQRDGRGPESRWALAQRAEEGAEATNAIIRILRRRLRPRGVLPVQRVPRVEVERLRIFNWVRQYVTLLLENLEQHLRVPLQPGEDALPEGEVSSPEALPEEASSEGVASGSVTRSRSRSRNISHGGSGNGSANTSEYACDSEGELVWVPPASPGDAPRGPPPPTPVNLPTWVTLEPVGIWREPPEEDDATATSTTTTTIEGDLDDAWLLQLATGTTPSSTTTPSSVMDDVNNDPMDPLVPVGTDLLACCAIPGMSCEPWSSTSTSTTTTTSTSSSSSQLWPADVIRDMVNVHLVQSDPSDAIALIHRLQERQRHLRHVDNLLRDAVQEALRWIQIPMSALPMNADMTARNVMNAIAYESTFGSGPTSSTSSNVVSSPQVWLQPNLPTSVDDVENSVPGSAPHVIAGYRRRAWHSHVLTVYAAAGREPPVGPWPAEEDEDLFIVQADPAIGVENWPSTLEDLLVEFVVTVQVDEMRMLEEVRNRMLEDFNVTVHYVVGAVYIVHLLDVFGLLKLESAARERHHSLLQDLIGREKDARDKHTAHHHELLGRERAANEERHKDVSEVLQKERGQREQAHNMLHDMVHKEKAARTAIEEVLVQEKGERTKHLAHLDEKVDSLQKSMGIFDSLVRKEIEERTKEYRRLWDAIDTHTHDLSTQVISEAGGYVAPEVTATALDSNIYPRYLTTAAAPTTAGVTQTWVPSVPSVTYQEPVAPCVVPPSTSPATSAVRMAPSVPTVQPWGIHAK
ncbi:unnamed protein product [Symbiodinium sp. CCMP2592]|nr:unnamed protein product [Symbiodinium sp. CCMP2592]